MCVRVYSCICSELVLFIFFVHIFDKLIVCLVECFVRHCCSWFSTHRDRIFAISFKFVQLNMNIESPHFFFFFSLDYLCLFLCLTFAFLNLVDREREFPACFWENDILAHVTCDQVENLHNFQWRAWYGEIFYFADRVLIKYWSKLPIQEGFKDLKDLNINVTSSNPIDIVISSKGLVYCRCTTRHLFHGFCSFIFELIACEYWPSHPSIAQDVCHGRPWRWLER